MRTSSACWCAEPPDSGFSLPLVLWTLLLIAVIVLGYVAAAQTNVRLAANDTLAVEAELMAEAGISIGIAELIAGLRSPGATQRLPFDGTPVVCRMESGAVLTLTLEDLAGKVNINVADAVLLRPLLVGLGLPGNQADALADRMLDYRDADSLKRLNGAERPAYQAAGLPGPANARFVVPEELAQVLGMPAGFVALMLPHITVDGDQAGLDPAMASPELIRILNRGLGNAARTGPAANSGAALPLPTFYLNRSRQTAFRIGARAQLADGSAASAAAIIAPLRQRTRAYTIQRWSDSFDPPLPRPSRNIGAC